MACHISLLGSFRVAIDEREVAPEDWRQRRAAELVKILALAPGHRMHREQLMDAMWPDLDLAAGAANLRKAVHFARRTLGSEGAVIVAGEMLSLFPKAELAIDVDRFEAAARAALTSDDPGEASAAAHLYVGELLPEDRYASWADEPRERLRLLALQVSRSAGSWERVLEIDPADEEAHRALMSKALASGDRTGAMRQFERLRERLRADLGMGPDRDSIALYEKALALEGDEPPGPAERARALVAWGLVHLNSGEFAEAERTGEAARALAIEAELGRELGEASALVGIAANMQGRWSEVFRGQFESAVKTAPELAGFVFDAHLCLAEFCLCGPTGHEEIAGYARGLRQVAEAASSVQGIALAELLLGEADLYSDRLDEAESHLRSSVTLHKEAGTDAGRIIATQHLAELMVIRDRRSDAKEILRDELEAAGTDALEPHLSVRIRGGLVDAADDVEEAIRTVEEADEALGGGVVCPPCAMGYRVAAARMMARAGDIVLARSRLDEVERFAGMWPGGPWHAALWEARGVLREVEGDRAQAAALFKEAAERFNEVGRPRDAARCLEAAARN